MDNYCSLNGDYQTDPIVLLHLRQICPGNCRRLASALCDSPLTELRRTEMALCSASMTIGSPSRNSAIGPPTCASGVMCPMINLQATQHVVEDIGNKKGNGLRGTHRYGYAINTHACTNGPLLAGGNRSRAGLTALHVRDCDLNSPMRPP